MKRITSALRNKIIFNLRKKIKKKVIVIESDDWGMERAPHQEAINYAERKYGADKLSRWTKDSLESPEDLEMLYSILESFSKNFEQAPVITANFITHNVQVNTNNSIHYLPIDQGFISQDIQRLKPLYEEGIAKGYIYPQLHGYVHYHKNDLEQYLQSERVKEFIQVNYPLMEATIKGKLHFLWGEMTMRNEDINKLFPKSVQTFERMFGFKSQSFIAPHYLFDLPLLQLLNKHGISYLQGASNYVNDEGCRLYFPSLRKRNQVVWGIRNARLDVHPQYSYFHEQCLNSIDRAFKLQMPAVIDMHRVNFSGRYTPELRDRTLLELNRLFSAISLRWPDACFMSSNQLNQYLYGTQKPN